MEMGAQAEGRLPGVTDTRPGGGGRRRGWAAQRLSSEGSEWEPVALLGESGCGRAAGVLGSRGTCVLTGGVSLAWRQVNGGMPGEMWHSQCVADK